jgi:hypothetical protein
MKTLALTVALLAPSLAAQQNIIWHDNQTTTVGAPNAFPFGVQGVRTQQLIPQSVLGSTPAVIQDVFVNPQISNSTSILESQVWYGDYEIRMGITQLSTLTNTWATNSPNPTTVYRGPLLVRFVRDQWVPLGLPLSYLWLPLTPADNLVVDFICWQVLDTGAVPPTVNGYFLNIRSSGATPPSISRAYRLGWTNGQPATSAGVDGQGIKLGFLLNDGNFVAHNGSCTASNAQVPVIGALPSTWPQLGQPFDVTLANAPALAIASLALGLETSNYLGVPLPLELTPLGAPGCRFWHSWELLLPVVLTDPSGNATATIALPAGPFQGVRLYGTWLVLDPAANAFGLVPSGFATLIL